MLTWLMFFVAGMNGYILMQAGWSIQGDLYWNAAGGAICLLFGTVRLIKGE